MESHHVVVHQFSPEFHKEIEDVNKEFMKWANMKNKEAKAVKKKPIDHLNERAAATNMNSLSDVALQKFIMHSYCIKTLHILDSFELFFNSKILNFRCN